jgi:hypothetical protein
MKVYPLVSLAAFTQGRRTKRAAQRAGASPWGVLSWTLGLWIGVVILQGAAGAEKAVTDSWLLVDTETHTVSVFRDEVLLERFDNVAIGRGGSSADKMRDDGTTPLGTFHIDRINRNSRFLVFFGFDYPSPEHAWRAFDSGRIDAEDYRRIIGAFRENQSPPQDTPLGGQLGIHGLGAGDPRIHDGFDWTQGCIALTNEQVKRLSHWVHLGMRVEVR